MTASERHTHIFQGNFSSNYTTTDYFYQTNNNYDLQSKLQKFLSWKYALVLLHTLRHFSGVELRQRLPPFFDAPYKIDIAERVDL